LFAQVSTNSYKKGNAFEKHPELNITKQHSPQIKMPLFDLASLLKEDKAAEGLGLPYRFGKSFDVNLGLKDGKWQKTDSTMVWSLKISSDNAYSLNFIFSELYLPKGGKMYIYNEDGSMVYGPVTDRQNRHGATFLTDIIQGESVIIFISVPNEKQPLVKLTIQNVIHGYKNMFGYLSLEKSAQSCEKDVACYPAWNDESDGVVQILLANGNELCSGSLLNNTAQDFKPYILTAFHCIDIGDPAIPNDPNRNNDTLELNEIEEAEEWLVRFRFKHLTCGGSTIATVRTFDDTHFRAAWHVTDFALVELQDDILRDEPSVGEKVWLGWDNSGNTPTEVNCIHHPAGDVMKYSYDNEIPTLSNNDGFNNTLWFVDDWTIGSTEKGSSGSPMLDQNSRIVGQDYKGCGLNPCDPNKGTYFGRLSRSWTGDSSNTTRLSNWLNPTGSTATTLNSVRQPVPEYSQIITNLCSTTSLSITNLAPGYYLHHWNKSSNVSFPNGNTGNPVQISPNANGPGWVEAVYHTGWGTVNMDTMYFWVGDPLPSDISLVVMDNLTGQQVPQDMMCPNTGYILICQNSNNQCNTSNYSWFLPYGMSLISTSGNTAYINTNSSPGGVLTVKAQTCCSANATIMSEVLATDGYDCDGWYMSFSPNPTTGETTLSIEFASEELGLKSVPLEPVFDKNTEWEFEVYNPNQTIKEKRTKLKGSSTTIQTQSWKEGVYVVRVKFKPDGKTEKILTGKLMVKK